MIASTVYVIQKITSDVICYMITVYGIHKITSLVAIEEVYIPSFLISSCLLVIIIIYLYLLK